MGLADAQRVVLPERLVVVGVVELVDDQEDGLLGLAQDAGDLLVLVGDAHGAVDVEDDGIGLVAGGDGLLADARCKDVVGLERLEAAGVDEDELPSGPIGLVV